MRSFSRSEEHTSELQSRGLISYAVFCLKKRNALPAVVSAVCPALLCLLYGVCIDPLGDVACTSFPCLVYGVSTALSWFFFFLCTALPPLVFLLSPPLPIRA